MFYAVILVVAVLLYLPIAIALSLVNRAVGRFLSWMISR